jgi:N-carbamoyl-L-amino-acid hydrolase
LYLELHIEQGPVLEQKKLSLGVVTGIVGILRYRVTITGQPNHAGTTPMTLRHDALTGFCEIGLAFETLCRQSYPTEIVGTIGRVQNDPNASNVIPGRVEFDLEIRSLDANVSRSIYGAFEKEAARIAEARGLSVVMEPLSVSEALQVTDNVRMLLREACAKIAPAAELPSGAGHDANQLGRIGPIGMIFVPSREGKSHCPEEWTDSQDIAAGVEALVHALVAYDSAPF